MSESNGKSEEEVQGHAASRFSVRYASAGKTGLLPVHRLYQRLTDKRAGRATLTGRLLSRRTAIGSADSGYDLVFAFPSRPGTPDTEYSGSVTGNILPVTPFGGAAGASVVRAGTTVFGSNALVSGSRFASDTDGSLQSRDQNRQRAASPGGIVAVKDGEVQSSRGPASLPDRLLDRSSAGVGDRSISVEIHRRAAGGVLQPLKSIGRLLQRRSSVGHAEPGQSTDLRRGLPADTNSENSYLPQSSCPARERASHYGTIIGRRHAASGERQETSGELQTKNRYNSEVGQIDFSPATEPGESARAENQSQGAAHLFSAGSTLEPGYRIAAAAPADVSGNRCDGPNKLSHHPMKQPKKSSMRIARAGQKADHVARSSTSADQLRQTRSGEQPEVHNALNGKSRTLIMPKANLKEPARAATEGAGSENPSLLHPHSLSGSGGAIVGTNDKIGQKGNSDDQPRGLMTPERQSLVLRKVERNKRNGEATEAGEGTARAAGSHASDGQEAENPKEITTGQELRKTEMVTAGRKMSGTLSSSARPVVQERVTPVPGQDTRAGTRAMKKTGKDLLRRSGEQAAPALRSQGRGPMASQTSSLIMRKAEAREPGRASTETEGTGGDSVLFRKSGPKENRDSLSRIISDPAVRITNKAGSPDDIRHHNSALVMHEAISGVEDNTSIHEGGSSGKEPKNLPMVHESDQSTSGGSRVIEGAYPAIRLRKRIAEPELQRMAATTAVPATPVIQKKRRVAEKGILSVPEAAAAPGHRFVAAFGAGQQTRDDLPLLMRRKNEDRAAVQPILQTPGNGNTLSFSGFTDGRQTRGLMRQAERTGSAEAEVEDPGVSTEAQSSAAFSSRINFDRIIDAVTRAISLRLEVERERRGLRRWI